MTDAENSAGTPASDANVNQVDEQNADAGTQKTGNEAESSTAVKKADDDVTDKVRSRIDELTKHRREAERDRDYWRELAMRDLQRAEVEPEKPAPIPVSQARTLADFDYDESRYQAYLREDVVKTARETLQAELRQQREVEQAQRRKSQFVQREQDFSKDIEDYLEVTRNPRLPITPHLAEAMAESEEGPALAYFLGKNLDVAERISQLPPLAAARELGRIEARLITEREKAKEKSVVSKAPPPPPKIDASGDGTPKVTADDPASDKLSGDEWLKLREKQLRKRK